MPLTHPRLIRELTTIDRMIRIYCQDHHHTAKALCAECAELRAYAEQRLERCPFQEAKSTCANCTVHCYNAQMRERVRNVMRYAGPRMLLRHPVLTVYHLLDGRRPAPKLKKRPSSE